MSSLQTRLLSLFAGPLEGVRFPDVDGELLAADARSVEAAQQRLETLRAELDEARGVLEDEQRKLEQRLERALAYVRVYAEGNETLLAELEPVRPSSVPTRRRRTSKLADVLVLPIAPVEDQRV